MSNKNKLVVEVSLRDCQLFSELLQDRVQVAERFLQEHSNQWSFLGNDEDCAELENEVRELVRECCDFLEVEFFLNGEELLG